MKQKIKTKGLLETMRSSNVLAVILALAVGMAGITPAYAFISNTATASGDAPDGSNVDDTDSVDVSVEPAGPELTIGKAAVLNDTVTADGLGQATETITYTYTVENSGNTTVNTVGITDTHDGSAALGTPVIDASSAVGTTGNATVDLLPGQIAIFSVTYTITAADVAASGGGGSPDGNLDNSAIAEGNYPDGNPGGVAVASLADTASVPLDISPSLNIAKAAYDDGVPTAQGGSGAGVALGTSSDVTAGTLITYVYSVINDGNVPIDFVDVADVHNGTGTLSAITLFSLDSTNGSVNVDGNPDQIDTLEPGDSAIFTATYTVTQADIDTLQ